VNAVPRNDRVLTVGEFERKAIVIACEVESAFDLKHVVKISVNRWREKVGASLSDRLDPKASPSLQLVCADLIAVGAQGFERVGKPGVGRHGQIFDAARLAPRETVERGGLPGTTVGPLGLRRPDKMAKKPTLDLRAIFYKEDARRRALDAISMKRRNPALSMTKAAKLTGTTLKTVKRHGGSALEVRSGRIDVKRTDHLTRRLRMLTAKGEATVTTRSSRTASRVSDFNNAVKEYYRSGDTTALERFRGKILRSKGEQFEFVTDPNVLDRLGRAGAVSFDDIYAAEKIA
jgi:hypothetical protein